MAQSSKIITNLLREYTHDEIEFKDVYNDYTDEELYLFAYKTTNEACICRLHRTSKGFFGCGSESDHEYHGLILGVEIWEYNNYPWWRYVVDKLPNLIDAKDSIQFMQPLLKHIINDAKNYGKNLDTEHLYMFDHCAIYEIYRNSLEKELSTTIKRNLYRKIDNIIVTLINECECTKQDQNYKVYGTSENGGRIVPKLMNVCIDRINDVLKTHQNVYESNQAYQDFCAKMPIVAAQIKAGFDKMFSNK